MPEANQYIFSTKEIIELCIKKADLHEGRWTILVGFGISAGQFGPTPNQMAPGVAVVANQIGVQRAAPDTPEVLVVDAAVLNPSRD
jgi:hypothetical protein